MNRDEKAAVVADLSGKFDKAKIAIVSDYRGLTVSSFEQLRRELKKNNAEIRVAKNTLLRKAIQGTPFEVMTSQLEGTTAITVSYADPVAPAKILTEFAKNHPELNNTLNKRAWFSTLPYFAKNPTEFKIISPSRKYSLQHPRQ